MRTIKLNVPEIEILCRHWADKMLQISKTWEENTITSAKIIKEFNIASSRLLYFQTLIGDRVKEIFNEQKRRDIDNN